MKLFQFILFAFFFCLAVSAKEYHVSKSGNNKSSGTAEASLLTIQAAADLAQPGDIIIVHQGVYRERVNPPRGGSFDDIRIIYQAAEGEKVVIKGSEVLKNWGHVKNDTWKLTLPNSYFGDFNPYKDIIHGEWYRTPKDGYDRHTGAVYLNEEWLTEAPDLDTVLLPAGEELLWFGKVDDQYTTLWAQFKGTNPNNELVEINVRQSVFYPDKPGRNYITVTGFTMCQAATPWSGAMSEQIGLIGTHWSKGWVIENNVISHSMNTGITLGRYELKESMPPISAPGYIESIKLALEQGWSKENIGSHLVRNNHISHCEKNGIHGSLGGIFSIIECNTICDISTQGWIDGADKAGIKLLGSQDVIIKGNRIVNCGRGIWMDWMAQGTRITANLCYHNNLQDLYSEVNHGPYLVDNNLFLSLCSVWDMSQGGAFVHNLMAGKLNMSPHSRETPFLQHHSTEIAGYQELLGGDNSFFNNIFTGGCEVNEDQIDPEYDIRTQYGSEFYGLKTYTKPAFPVRVEGNVYWKDAAPGVLDENRVLELDYDPEIMIKEEGGEVFLCISYSPAARDINNKLITSSILGKSLISGQAFENPDGTSYQIDTDYLGEKRNISNTQVGPFEKTGCGMQKMKVWGKK